MTVTAAGGTYYHLQGLSTDEKPLDVQDGATFHVIDTGALFFFLWEEVDA